MANYPVPYQNNWGYGVGQQVYPQIPQYPAGSGAGIVSAGQQAVSGTQGGSPGLIWVDGEIGAKAYQMPAGWPANQPVALWDTNDTVIYLKSTNPMGMPLPLQKAHYTLETVHSGEKTSGYSGDAEKAVVPDMSEYVKKTDLEKMKQDLMDTIGSMGVAGGRRSGSMKGE